MAKTDLQTNGSSFRESVYATDRTPNRHASLRTLNSSVRSWLGRLLDTPLPDSALEAEVKNVDPNNGSCFLTMQRFHVRGGIAFCRLLGSCADTTLTRLECAWGMEFGSLKIHLSWACLPLRLDWETMFEEGEWGMLPETCILEEIHVASLLLRDSGNSQALRNILASTTSFRYRILPFKSMKSLYIHRFERDGDNTSYVSNDQAPSLSVHMYPYTSLGALESHLQPQVAVFDLARKLEAHESCDPGLYENDLKLVNAIYDIWMSARIPPGTPSERSLGGCTTTSRSTCHFSWRVPLWCGEFKRGPSPPLQRPSERLTTSALMRLTEAHKIQVADDMHEEAAPREVTFAPKTLHFSHWLGLHKWLENVNSADRLVDVKDCLPHWDNRRGKRRNKPHHQSQNSICTIFTCRAIRWPNVGNWSGTLKWVCSAPPHAGYRGV
ncbi:uncharacterized protein EI90DRAFT_3055441, partial [Cantharellus anzutake]|uniref:uncharacterized protein n=1 Tax=Cantharellus anzutake TaxID=1750568 RepID=UPI001902F6F4